MGGHERRREEEEWKGGKRGGRNLRNHPGNIS